MAQVILVFLTMMCCCIASQAARDLAGKVFIFPEKGDTAHVRLTPLLSEILFSATVCLRFYTDDLHNTEISLFSMSVPTQENSIVLVRSNAHNRYDLYIGDHLGFFYGLPFELNKWHSICATWDASTGLSQVTVNGVRSVKTRCYVGGSIAGTPIALLGQEQDSYGGGFDASQAFKGHIKDVHMWDHVISSCEIKNYMQGLAHSPGNYLDWTRMDYSVHGFALLEEDDTC